MLDSSRPLYSLSVGEFIDLIRDTVSSLFPARQLNENEKEEHFNIKQCAQFLHCSKVSVHNYKKLGLPYYKVGRKVLFNKSQVLEFMSKRPLRLVMRRKAA